MDPGKGSEPAKPKFRPKAQAKKKPPPPPLPSAADYRGAAASYRSGRGGGAGDDGRGDGRGRRDRRGYEGRGGGGRHWQDNRSGGRGGRDGRGGGRGRGRQEGGRGRGGFVPVGQDFFVGGGGSGPTAYMPSGVSMSGEGGGAGARGGGDTSESEDDKDRRSSSKTKKPSAGSSVTKQEGKAGTGSGSSSTPRVGFGMKNDGDEDEDEEDMFGVGEGVSADAADEEGGGEGEGKGDLFSLMGDGGTRRKPKSSKLPGMRVTGNVMSEEDGMRPVALPVTATAQIPGTRLFAQADNQAELAEEEDSSLFFVQLPTKLPRPLPAFQRGKDGGSKRSGGGKGKGKASGSGAVKEEVGDSPASEGAAGGSGSKGKSGAGAGAGASGLPIEDLAFDQGLRRMRAGKIGKLYVHQSGKARLVIGGVSLVVHPGLPVSFMEQGVSIDAAGQKSFCSFGQVTKRAVCTPDFEQLYRRADENNIGGGEDGLEGGGPVKMEVS